MMYGMTPFGRNAFDLFNLWNDIDKSYDSMPVNACKTDIKDVGDKYVMESELPGFEKEDIKLDINGEFLVISAEHTAENAEALTLTLTDAELAALDRAFPAPTRKVPLDMQ